MINGERNSALLRKYFKNGCLSRKDILLASLNRKIPYYLNSAKIASLYHSNNRPVNENLKPVALNLKPYQGTNPFAGKIKTFLETNLKDDLLGAYIHGSVGNSEEISYSDFDGFVILKNSVFKNSGSVNRVAFLLNKSEIFMTEMDPLQHHGWFIITEDDLKNYPEDYLPHELWQYSSVLTGQKELVVSIRQSGYQQEFVAAYGKFSGHLLHNLHARKFLNDYYSLKSVLSGFMLLPSIYLQAKTGTAIFKKFSFPILKEELGADYAIMDDVSAIRATWKYQPNGLYRFLLRNKPFLLSLLFKKQFSGNVSPSLKKMMNDAFIERMITFVQLLNKKLEK